MPRFNLQIPDDASTEMIDLPTGATLRVVSRGNGPVLVLVPGWTCSADFFAAQLLGLADRYRVVAYDPRGHGESPDTLTGNSFTQRGADLRALIEHLGEDKVHLLGWSFGVFDVLAYLRDNGFDRVDHLILCDETPKCPANPNDPDDWGETPLTPDGIVALLRAVIDDRRGFWTAYAAYMLGLPDDTPPDDEDIARVVELGLKTPDHVAIATAADGSTTDLSATASAASRVVPTLFIAREDWAGDARSWVGRNMPDARFDTMPLHMGFATHPDDFNSQVASFLSR